MKQIDFVVAHYISFRYFLISRKNVDVDMKSLKRKSLIIVWLCFVAHGSIYGLLSQYWRWGQKTELKDGVVQEPSKWNLLVRLASTMSFANLPDFISIIIYLRLWHKINKSTDATQVVENVSVEQEPGAIGIEDPAHGNIFPDGLDMEEPLPIPQIIPQPNQQVPNMMI